MEKAKEFVENAGCRFVSYETAKKNSKPYVSFICNCSLETGKISRKQLRCFKDCPTCDECIDRTRITDDEMSKYLSNQDMVFVSSERVRTNNKTRTFANFICSCDKDTTRVVKRMVWDNLRLGSKCLECVKERREQTNMDRLGVKNAFQSAEKMQKARQTMIEKYGVEYPAQNAEIRQQIEKSGKKIRYHEGPFGKIFACQGYEPLALDILFDQELSDREILSEQEICEDERFPQFWYEFGGKQHRYFPDLFVIPQDRFIEVKSEYTFNMNMEINMAKKKCVEDAGFNIEIWIFDKNEKFVRSI